MKKRRIVIIAMLLMLALSGIFLLGAAKRSFLLTVQDGQEIVLQKSYTIRFSTKWKTFFMKGGYRELFDGLTDKLNAPELLNAELAEDLERVAVSCELPCKDATVRWDKEQFFYTSEEIGTCVDRMALIRDVFYHLGAQTTVTLKKFPVPPAVTEEALKKITVETASFSTVYESSADNRKHNIALAVSFLNGTVLPAGAEFSFNATVGDRSLERGFLEAKIISGGKFVTGVGGGVCQVSTTLYNTAIRAGLEVTKVTSHSLPVGYVDLSFDAMVTSASDLVFRNTTGHPVYIKGEADGKTVKFTFYGAPVYAEKTVVFRSEIIKVLYPETYEDILDSSQLAEGENERILVPHKPGYVSEGYRDIYEDGKLISSLRIRRDTYQPQKGIRILRDSAE
jgi:vancomycin resistance protein YoaR